MKKLIMGVMALFVPMALYAGGPVAYSSFTATNDTGKLLRSVTSTNTIVQTLSAVVVSSASAGGQLLIYNSTWTTTGQVANISLNVTGYYEFHDVVMKGITYSTTGNGSGVTIIYKY